MIEIKKKTAEELDAILRDILSRETYIDKEEGGQIGYEVYLDYRDEIGDESLAKISKADNPQEMMWEIENEWLWNAEDYYYPELLKTIEKEIEDRDDMEFEDYEDEIRAWIDENVYWYMPDRFTDQEVDVVVSLDVGDMNYDFTCNDVLNWYGRYNEKNELDPNSPIKWLAKQQKKLTELKQALREEYLSQSTDFQKTAFGRAQDELLQFAKDLPKGMLIQKDTCEWMTYLVSNLENDDIEGILQWQKYVKDTLGKSCRVSVNKEYSKFVKTTIQELQNVCNAMNTLIFLCRMSLREFIELKELINSEKELNDSYDYDERKGTKSFTISKNATCGLFNPWDGGGSVLEIELDKDAVIPTKAIFDVWIDCRGSRCNGRGYDVADVYGIWRGAFNGTVTINVA